MSVPCRLCKKEMEEFCRICKQPLKFLGRLAQPQFSCSNSECVMAGQIETRSQTCVECRTKK